jgi:hypothetical protein
MPSHAVGSLRAYLAMGAELGTRAIPLSSPISQALVLASKAQHSLRGRLFFGAQRRRCLAARPIAFTRAHASLVRVLLGALVLPTSRLRRRQQSAVSIQAL